ncbi:MAG: hypothetical protein AB7O21_21050 [Gammaproteobacteria bacterium]
MIAQSRVDATRRALVLALLWGCADVHGAPHRTIAQAEAAARDILDVLVTAGADAAVARARAESHLDDPRVQRNLDWAGTGLPDRARTLGALTSVETVGTDRFMSAFVRFTYRVRCTRGDLRVMLTFRRKTAGWRLNQLYFD